MNKIVMENLTSFELAKVVNIGLHLLGVRWHLEYDQEHDAFIMTKGGINETLC